MSFLAGGTLCVLRLYIDISHDNLFEKGGSRNPPSRYSTDLKLILPSVWTTSITFAKFQVFISILTWFKRHLNIAIFAKSYFFCITALASFGTKLPMFVTIAVGERPRAAAFGSGPRPFPGSVNNGLRPLPSAAAFGQF